MPKSICVYLHDADPTIHSPHFRISRDDCQRRLAAGYVRYLSPSAVQLKPPPDYLPEVLPSGLFNQAWRPRFSDHFLVWQMRPTMSDPEEI